MLFSLQLKGRLLRRHKLLLWGVLIPLELMTQIGSGFLYPLLRFGFLLGLLYIFVMRRLPWKAVFVFVLLGLFLMGARDVFRTLHWRSKAPTKGDPFEMGIQFLSLTGYLITIADFDFAFKRLESVTQRADLSSLFGYVVERTPKVIPYWGGETYSTLFWRFIPRIIVPDKPQELTTSTFPDRYGLRQSRDSRTAVRLPQLVEMYINFGVLGVITGMFIIGLIYQVLYYILNHSSAGEWWQVSSAIIFSSLLDIEGNFTRVFGNVIYWIVILYIFGMLVRKKVSDQPV
jgi:hypothetical protein